jgi:large subunit ribosomal protein L9
MKVIVIKSFSKSKNIGEVVEVKDGYARNFLIPGGFALQATRDNFARLESIKRKEEKMAEKKKEKFIAVKEKIENISITIPSEVKDEDEIYGSIGEAQILKSLSAEGIEVGDAELKIDEAIKKIGVYNIKVKLHPEVEANLRVWVVKK